jgi:hypothetical protein
MEPDQTSALNEAGFFFQKWCAQKIIDADWIVESEEYPIAENQSFDIRATKVLFETSLHNAVVECKKQNPQTKKWIFYTTEETTAPKNSPFLIQTHNLNVTAGGFLSKGSVVRGVYEGLNESKLGFPCCHTVGLELFRDQKNKWEVNSQIIFNACITVAKGTNYLFETEAERLLHVLDVGLKTIEQHKAKYGWQYLLGGSIFPVVITSAPLFSVSFDVTTMNTASFEVSHNESNYTEKEWLVYEFPLPKELRLESKDAYKLIGDSRYAKMHIFIVNGRSVTKFFKCLTDAIENRSEKSWRALRTEFMDFYNPKKK